MILIVLPAPNGNIGTVTDGAWLFSFLSFIIGSFLGFFLREVHETIDGIDTKLIIEIVDDKPGRFTKWILNM